MLRRAHCAQPRHRSSRCLHRTPGPSGSGLHTLHVPVCARHAFTSESATCPQSSRLLAPPAHVRVHTHARAHVSAHTPSPQLRPGGGLGQTGGRGLHEAGGAGRRGRCHRGRRALRPRRKLLAAAGVPSNAEASPAPHGAGKRRRPHRQGVSRAPGFKWGRARRKGRVLLVTFRVAIPPGPRTVESGLGALPVFTQLPAFPGAGALWIGGRTPQNAKVAHATAAEGAPQALQAPGPSARAPGPRSLRKRRRRSSPSGRRALTDAPRGTRRPRTGRCAGPSSQAPRPPPRAPWRALNCRSGFRR